jgi:hypothetical protein
MGFLLEPPPVDDLIWGAAATKGALTLPHVDDEGFATVVAIVSGSKYWVVMQPKDGVPDGGEGDQGTLFAYPSSWSYGETGCDVFEAEGIMLTAGDVL